jgi:uncharacterized RDD family membrane protein YckC
MATRGPRRLAPLFVTSRYIADTVASSPYDATSGQAAMVRARQVRERHRRRRKCPGNRRSRAEPRRSAPVHAVAMTEPAVAATPLSPPPRYVGFWARVFAAIVDTVLLTILIAVVGYFVYGGFTVDGSVDPHDFSSTIVSLVLPAAIVIVFWLARAATPGKMLIAARIVDADSGAAPTTRQALLRYVAYYLSALVFGLGFVWVAFDRRKQGWHDKLARTVVVYDPRS